MKSTQSLTKIGIVALALALSGGTAVAENFGDVKESHEPSVFQKITLTLFPGFRDDGEKGIASSFYGGEQGEPAFANELREQKERHRQDSANRLETETSTVGNVLRVDF